MYQKVAREKPHDLMKKQKINSLNEVVYPLVIQNSQKVVNRQICF